jgi:hypothetical protein
MPVALGQLEDHLAELPVDRLIVAMCRSGRRSAMAADMLNRRGYRVANLTGSMTAWATAGLPVSEGAGESAPWTGCSPFSTTAASTGERARQSSTSSRPDVIEDRLEAELALDWTRPGAPAATGRNHRPRSGAGSRRDLEDTDTGRRRVAIASRWQPAGRP